MRYEHVGDDVVFCYQLKVSIFNIVSTGTSAIS